MRAAPTAAIPPIAQDTVELHEKRTAPLALTSPAAILSHVRLALTSGECRVAGLPEFPAARHTRHANCLAPATTALGVLIPHHLDEPTARPGDARDEF